MMIQVAGFTGISRAKSNPTAASPGDLFWRDYSE